MPFAPVLLKSFRRFNIADWTFGLTLAALTAQWVIALLAEGDHGILLLLPIPVPAALALSAGPLARGIKRWAALANREELALTEVDPAAHFGAAAWRIAFPRCAVGGIALAGLSGIIQFYDAFVLPHAAPTYGFTLGAETRIALGAALAGLLFQAALAANQFALFALGIARVFRWACRRANGRGALGGAVVARMIVWTAAAALIPWLAAWAAFTFFFESTFAVALWLGMIAGVAGIAAKTAFDRAAEEAFLFE